MADVVPELARTAAAPGSGSRTSLPYPSFSKAHSKEAVNSREDVSASSPSKHKPNIYTPEATDVGSAEESRRSMDDLHRRKSKSRKDERPPSPPETEFSEQKKDTSRRTSKIREEVEEEPRSSSRNSWFAGTSKVSVKSKGSSKASTAIKSPKVKQERDQLRAEMDKDEDRGSGVDSNATSVAPRAEQKPPILDTDSSPASLQDSSPRTPTQTPQFPPPDIKPTPSPFVAYDEASEVSGADFQSPLPPPPPPPPDVPVNIPRIDYLMQNGGLLRPAPKTLLSVTPGYTPQHGMARSAGPTPAEVARVFSPYLGLLDQYETVINKNGSLAVATGYRSVARRLLDRLENVFARDLSSEGCTCIMCQSPESVEGSRGLGWGEVLEWVSGRREVPSWPAFDLATLGGKSVEDAVGLGISKADPARPSSPVKLDPDIADEFREHYLQQSKKTKAAVNRWLSSCTETATTAPPQEVDDETLSFAILTHLDSKDRPYYNALISGSTTLQPASRAPTPFRKPRTDFLVKTGLSLQRLYRLATPPRDPESVAYLVKNPHMHNLLATLSGIVPSEWEILISGRFDGFLWSGADTELPSRVASPSVSRGPTPAGNPQRRPMSPAVRQMSGSRTTTPFSQGGAPSRGPTPASFVGSSAGGPQRQPVSNDEEAELAALAEIEREIYLGMEALEDAFEALHRKAEAVRKGLRERSAGLSMAMQSRRAAYPEPTGTPGFAAGGMGPGYERGYWEGSEVSESDWDYDDFSEIAPDDSASNISSSRHRRPKRRNERRTPALVEEEDEN